MLSYSISCPILKKWQQQKIQEEVKASAPRSSTASKGVLLPPALVLSVLFHVLFLSSQQVAPQKNNPRAQKHSQKCLFLCIRPPRPPKESRPDLNKESNETFMFQPFVTIRDDSATDCVAHAWRCGRATLRNTEERVGRRWTHDELHKHFAPVIKPQTDNRTSFP